MKLVFMKKINCRGRDRIIPIIGEQVVELCFRYGRLPLIITVDDAGLESQLRFEGRIVLVRGRAETTLDLPAIMRQWRESEILEIIGDRIQDALAVHQGELVLTFASGLVLRSQSTGGEHWHFQYPRPDRASDHTIEHVFLSG